MRVEKGIEGNTQSIIITGFLEGRQIVQKNVAENTNLKKKTSCYLTLYYFYDLKNQ